jgi:poly-beta-1,6-N-acetyl-D-glucosamine synthase
VKGNHLKYILITPARNESSYIEKVIQSVMLQTILPSLWVIVDDNSSDRTAEIVGRYARTAKWITLLRTRDNTINAFPSKAYSFNAGYDYIRKKGVPYDIVGSLDADISFSADYFEFLLAKFRENPRLGVAGTDYVENKFHSVRDTKASKLHVNGQCQLFRKMCFDDIGGLKPIQSFGEDLFAVIMARYQGWETNSFSERVFVHHRPIGTKSAGPLVAKFNHGGHDYILGNAFLWQLLRAVYWTKNKPCVFGGIMLFLGYVWSFTRGDSIVLSPTVLKAYRREQYQRLMPIFKEFLEKTTVKGTSGQLPGLS